MSEPEASQRPLRVAVIGSGPAGLYIVQHLLQAGSPEVRFFGNVEYGADLLRDELEDFYDQIVFCTGAQSDRRLGIPGEELAGSHSATEFVAWYNGHPDCANLRFDLSCRSAAAVGVGNVAVYVAEYALKAPRGSQVREVHLVGRRGPLQAAFSNPELCREAFAAESDRATQRRLDILESYATTGPSGKSRRLNLRFLVSPVEILGNGRVESVRMVRNELYRSDDGSLRPRLTDSVESLEACRLPTFRSTIAGP